MTYKKLEEKHFGYVYQIEANKEIQKLLQKEERFSLLFDGTARRHQYIKFLASLLAPPSIVILTFAIFLRYCLIYAGFDTRVVDIFFVSVILSIPFAIVFVIYRYLLYKENQKNSRK